MTANERRLAKALAVVAAVALSLVAIALGVERIGDARARVAELERGIARLERVAPDEAALRARLDQLRAGIDGAERRVRAGSAAEMSEFGRDVKRALASRGISPLKYQAVSSARGEELELSLRCEIGAFLGFLKSATGGGEGWVVPYLSVRMAAEGSRAEITLRIYE
jgi:hypothetical protein